jgi:hypothetical protein
MDKKRRTQLSAYRKVGLLVPERQFRPFMIPADYRLRRSERQGNRIWNRLRANERLCL